MQDASEIQTYFSREVISTFEKRGRFAPFFALVIEVPYDECSSIEKFVHDFIFHPDKPWLNFSLVLKPHRFEGGSCVSFASDAISNARSLQRWAQSFWRSVDLPEELLGKRHAAKAPYKTTPYISSLDQGSELLISKTKLMMSHWNTDDKKISILFVDPELIIYSFQIFFQAAIKFQNKALTKYQSSQFLKTKRFLAARKFNSDESINVDIYSTDNEARHYQEMNSDFDQYFKRSQMETNSLIQKYLTRGFALDIVNLPYGVGVLMQQ